MELELMSDPVEVTFWKELLEDNQVFPVLTDENFTITPKDLLDEASLDPPGVTYCPPCETECVSTKKRKLDSSDEPVERKEQKITPMATFDEKQLLTWKHVLYNLLTEYHNNPSPDALIKPCKMELNGEIREGFEVRPWGNSERELTELYALHVGYSRVVKDSSNRKVVLKRNRRKETSRLYKKYHRRMLQITCKYFQKVGSSVYLFIGQPLWVPNGQLEDAQRRIKGVVTKQYSKRISAYRLKPSMRRNQKKEDELL